MLIRASDSPLAAIDLRDHLVSAMQASARTESEHRAASRRLGSERACLDHHAPSGVGIVLSETVAREWLGQAGTPVFKKLLSLIK